MAAPAFKTDRQPGVRERQPETSSVTAVYGEVGRMQDSLQQQFGGAAITDQDEIWSRGQSMMLIGGASVGLWGVIGWSLMALLG